MLRSRIESSSHDPSAAIPGDAARLEVDWHHQRILNVDLTGG